MLWAFTGQPMRQYLRIHTDNIQLALKSCSQLDIQFVNVTHPLKQAALQESTLASPTARKLGAANCLRLQQNGRWFADNTDPDGVQFALDQLRLSRPIADSTVLIIGAGGAANAAASACIDRNIPVSIACRSTAKLSPDLLRYDRLSILDLHHVQDAVQHADVIIWTVPDYPDGLALTGLLTHQHVLDARYGFQRPDGFFGRATVLDGLSWLVGQGVAFFRHLYPALEPRDDDRILPLQDKLRHRLQPTPETRRHLALIGFMGAGKTTVGKILGARMDRPFVDSDTIIEERTGMAISDLFATRGESGFRKLEQKVLEELTASPHPAVIALGGGAPCQPAIMQALNRNCDTIWLLRDLATLRNVDPSNRPLLLSGDPLTRFTTRLKAYGSASDLVVPVGDASPATVANEILSIW